MFKHLFDSMVINDCTIPNRLVVPAMVANYCDEDGKATERYIAYHEEKAKGGWGLIITEDYAINEHAMGYHNIAGLWKDEQIPSHAELTERIHKYDSKIFAQIYHAGRQSCSFVNRGVQPVAPSAIPCPWLREMPRELSITEIKELVTQFGDCALRVKKAGFDGIEIHTTHGYLINEFLSPHTNKRTDEYGGTVENRMLFLREIYQDVRSKVGKDFPVIARMGGSDGFTGGRNIADAVVQAQIYEEIGFDALNISAGMYGDYNNSSYSMPMYGEHAWAVPYAEEIKKIVSVPVFTAIRINDPRMADSIITMGKADFVGMARGSLADPYLPEKAKNGDLNGIRYCVGCLQGCTGSLYVGKPITCLVNPSLGFEYKNDYTKVDNPKKVYIAGGGPAGMEAARVATIRGHKVILFEKKECLGGQFRSAAYPPGKGELASYTTWLINELKKLNVEIRCSEELTKEIVEKDKPDVVIIATGGKAVIPSIDGINKPHVLFAEDVLLGKVTTGDNVVIAGGGEVGSETASLLASEQKNVTVIEMQPNILNDLDSVNTLNLKNILKKHDVDIHLNTKVIEIADKHVIVEKGGERLALEADTIIIALGYKPDQDLYEAIKDVCSDIKVIGGAGKTSNAMIASREGFEIGMEI